LEPVFLDAELFKGPFQEHHAAECFVVAFGVMTVAGVASQDQHTIGAEFKGTKDEGGFDTAAAHNADGTYIGSALHSRGPCQVRTAV
jgi:uncharacterized protein with FMN-binding domain